jgi:hypothetical protein
MKTIITISFLIATAIISQTSFAGGNLNVAISSLENRKAMLEVSHNDDKAFEIEILNPMGESIYYHQTNRMSPEFKKNLDLSSLEEGIYRLSVKTDGGSKEQLITIGKDGISYGEEKMKTDPFFSYKNDQLNLSFLNHHNESMNIYLYQKGELIFEKNLANESSISKGFDLGKLRKGEYQVVFAAGEEIYEYKLTRE